jgi:hypothetical protein
LFNEYARLHDDFESNFVDEADQTCALYMRFKCCVEVESSFEKRFNNPAYIGWRTGTSDNRMRIERKTDEKQKQVMFLIFFD